MKSATIYLESMSPYTQSRMHNTPKREKESAEDYEERTWREKCTYDVEGFICIPAIAFKQSLDQAAKMLGMQTRGKATFTKHFLAGIMVPDNLRLPVKKDEVDRIFINANADGVRGSGKRVQRCFPQIPQWSGAIEIFILDDIITPTVFEKHFHEAGKLVGIGQYRPQNGGTNGRFRCVKFDWREV